MNKRQTTGMTDAFTVRKAGLSDLDAVCTFYQNVIHTLENSTNYPLWEWGVHPTEDMIRKAIENGQMSVLCQDSQIAGAAFLNEESADGYDRLSWQCPDTFQVIHLFAVSDALRGTGAAGYFLEQLLENSRSDGFSSIRLDLIAGNEPARKLYLKHGFVSRGFLDLQYDNEDPLHFELMEKVL